MVTNGKAAKVEYHLPRSESVAAPVERLLVNRFEMVVWYGRKSRVDVNAFVWRCVIVIVLYTV